ncbi:MAG: exosortase X [Luteibaculaceae bacterium]
METTLSLKNPVVKFLLTAALLYLAWYSLYELVLKNYTNFDRLVIDNVIWIAGVMLQSFGFDLIPNPHPDDPIRTIGIDGSHGVWVGDPCNGISIFGLFALFVVAYPGKWINKLWFIPMGILIIHLANAIRIAALAAIVYYDPSKLEFNHTYTFTIFVYSFVVLLWYIWANKLSVK